MPINHYVNALETRILSATSLELVDLLYEGAISAVREAKHHLAQKNIPERAGCVSKAVEIVAELHGSLDHKAGGELSLQLSMLYDYIQRVLLEANYQQKDDGLKEAESLLVTLREAWIAVSRAAGTATPATIAKTETVPGYYPSSTEAEFGVTAARQWSA